MLISFVIPCYNVEKYIETCVHSVFTCGMSAEEMEVICINDASTDHTRQELSKLKSIYPKLQIVDFQTNQGLSVARNRGLEYAKGDYIWFVDSDDAIIYGTISEMMQLMIAGNLDVLCFNYNDLNEKGEIWRKYKVFSDSDIMSGKDFVKNVFGENLSNHLGYVWRFLYRREYLLNNEITFPEFQSWEDTAYVPRAMLLAERIQSTELVGYNYYHHTSSVTVVYTKRRLGKLLFERTFLAGRNLLQLAYEVQDKIISKRLINIAQNDYLNDFIFPMCQSSTAERKVFYRMVRSHYNDVIKPLLPYITFSNQLLLNRYIGSCFAEWLALMYSIKRKMKCKNQRQTNDNATGLTSEKDDKILSKEGFNLSIIIPVYNAGQYIEGCLNSVANQTYKDFQCVIVNDGSTDNSQAVIDDFCQRDKRFVSIVKPNEKSAYLARKYAIDRIDTEWLMHVDADDVIVPDFVERMIRRQQETDADVVCARLVGCKKGIEGVDYTVPVSAFDMSQVMKGPDAFLQTIGGWGMSANAGVLYRKRLTEAIPYKGYINSDEFSQRLLLYYADRVAFEDVQYLYRANEGILETFSTRIYSCAQTYKDLLAFVDCHFPYNAQRRKKISRQYHRNLIRIVYEYMICHRQLQPADKR